VVFQVDNSGKIMEGNLDRHRLIQKSNSYNKIFILFFYYQLLNDIMTMPSNNTIILVVVGLILGGLYFNKSSKEGYADVWYNGGLDSTVLQRPTFNSNLDPNNMTLRSDPYVYGGFLKGQSPNTGVLAANNLQSGEPLGPQETIASFRTGVDNPYTSIERFSPTFTGSGAYSSAAGDQTLGAVKNGKYAAGMNDAANFTNYSDFTNLRPNKQMMLANTLNMTTSQGNANFGSAGTDFAYLATPGSVQQQKMQETRKYKASLDNSIPNTLEYTLPSELLPTPDMRQPLMRDPSDPSNFMYDRTLFAPLKTRNINTPDRFRGDLDIQPIKTGMWDFATNPAVDNAKGYFSYFNDINQYQDLQDISYQRARDSNGGELMQSSQKLNNLLTSLNNDMMKPNPVYASPPPLNFGPLKQENNPWYNSATNTVNSVWAK
jgi:hypothetical protein